jgi:dipeptide transport system permease protein
MNINNTSFSGKLASTFVTLVGITLFAFFLVRMAPGDPVLLLIGERGADSIQYAEMAAQLGLDQSIFNQFLNFIAQAFQGNLGHSVVSDQPVLNELMSRWPATVELGITAMLMAIIIGIPAGIFAALYRNRFPDFCIMTCALIGYSMPIFWWGLLLILFFSIGLDLTPVSGRLDILIDIEPVTGFMFIDTLLPEAINEYGFSAFISALHHIFLPAFAMSTIPIAVFARMTRSSMLEILSEDYIRTARAKGLSEFKVVCRHALRNALIPIITVGGILFITSAITGAILTERVFGWPGIGSYIVSSVYARDYPVIQGSILLIGVFVVLINLVIDQLYRVANPRMRN